MSECPSDSFPAGVYECQSIGGRCIAPHELGCCCVVGTGGGTGGILAYIAFAVIGASALYLLYRAIRSTLRS